MIKSKDFIKHKNYRDVCVKVNYCNYFDQYFVIKGSFWNLGFKQTWPMIVPFKAKLKKDDFKDWLMVDKRESIPIGIKSLRYAQWIPILK